MTHDDLVHRVCAFEKLRRHRGSLGPIGFDERAMRLAIFDHRDLPRDIERILHADVHTAAAFRRMALRRVARPKDGSMLIAARHALPHAPLTGTTTSCAGPTIGQLL